MSEWIHDADSNIRRNHLENHSATEAQPTPLEGANHELMFQVEETKDLPVLRLSRAVKPNAHRDQRCHGHRRRLAKIEVSMSVPKAEAMASLCAEQQRALRFACAPDCTPGTRRMHLAFSIASFHGHWSRF
jgi:hypothetical protein